MECNANEVEKLAFNMERTDLIQKTDKAKGPGIEGNELVESQSLLQLRGFYS